MSVGNLDEGKTDYAIKVSSSLEKPDSLEQQVKDAWGAYDKLKNSNDNGEFDFGKIRQTISDVATDFSSITKITTDVSIKQYDSIKASFNDIGDWGINSWNPTEWNWNSIGGNLNFGLQMGMAGAMEGVVVTVQPIKWAVDVADTALMATIMPSLNVAFSALQYTIDLGQVAIDWTKGWLDPNSSNYNGWFDDDNVGKKVLKSVMEVGADLLNDLGFGDSDKIERNAHVGNNLRRQVKKDDKFNELLFHANKASESLHPELPNTLYTKLSIKAPDSVNAKTTDTKEGPAMKNGIITMLAHQLPDAMTNMFDVFFIIYESDGKPKFLYDGFTSTEKTGYAEAIRPILLSSRIGSIKLPGSAAGVSQYKAFGTTIEKPQTVIQESHQSSFSIRADSNLYWIDMFNKLSGHDYCQSSTWFTNKDSGNLKYAQDQNKDVVFNWAELPKEYRQFPKFITSGKFNGLKGQMDILVRRVVPLSKSSYMVKVDAKGNSMATEKSTKEIPYSYKAMVDEAYGSPNVSNFQPGPWSSAISNGDFTGNIPQYDRQMFIFDDVELLGTGNLQFKRDSADTQTLSYDFIYRDFRMIEVS